MKAGDIYFLIKYGEISMQKLWRGYGNIKNIGGEVEYAEYMVGAGGYDHIENMGVAGA